MQLEVSWDDIKDIVDNKNIKNRLTYIEGKDTYWVILSDGPCNFLCKLSKVMASDISDFLNNYAPYANQNLGNNVYTEENLLKVDANLSGLDAPDFRYQIATGSVPTYTSIKIVGNNPAISTVEETIWGSGGDMYVPSSAAQLSIVSMSPNDTSDGTGARTVKLIGLDASYLEQEETVTMNGTTPVNTVNSYIRLNHCEVLTAGSNNVNAGGILISHSGNGLRCMPAGEGHNCTAAYTIPDGYIGLITDLYFIGSASASNKEIEGHLVTQKYGQARIHSMKFQLMAGEFVWKPDIPLKLDAKTDIEMRAIVTTSGTLAISAGFSLILVGV